MPKVPRYPSGHAQFSTRVPQPAAPDPPTAHRCTSHRVETMSPPVPPSAQPASSPRTEPAPISDASTAVSGEAGAAVGASATPTVPPPQAGAKKRRSRQRKKAPAGGGSSPSAKAEAQKLTHLVIDSGAIIKGAGMTLASAAEVRRVEFMFLGLTRLVACVVFVFCFLVVVGAC